MVYFVSLVVGSILNGIEDYLISTNTFTVVPLTFSPSSFLNATSTTLTTERGGGLSFYILSTIIITIYYLVALINIFVSGVHKIASSILSKLNEVTFVELARHIFLNGPLLKGYGFWAGLPVQDICGTLSGMGSSHWERNVENKKDCDQLITANVYGYLLIPQSILLMFVSFKYVNRLWERFRSGSGSPDSQPGFVNNLGLPPSSVNTSSLQLKSFVNIPLHDK